MKLYISELRMCGFNVDEETAICDSNELFKYDGVPPIVFIVVLVYRLIGEST